MSYHFQQIEVQTGIREGGFVAVTFPPTVDLAQTPIVIKGTYSLLSKLNNTEED